MGRRVAAGRMSTSVAASMPALSAMPAAVSARAALGEARRRKHSEARDRNRRNEEPGVHGVTRFSAPRYVMVRCASILTSNVSVS